LVSLGPNGILIAKTVPISGNNAGFANVAGFLTAFYVHGTLSILGISVILMKSSEAIKIYYGRNLFMLCREAGYSTG